jgi:hypothetical protein
VASGDSRVEDVMQSDLVSVNGKSCRQENKAASRTFWGVRYGVVKGVFDFSISPGDCLAASSDISRGAFGFVSTFASNFLNRRLMAPLARK